MKPTTLFLIGALIGIVSKLDQFMEDPTKVLTKEHAIRGSWLTLNLIMAGVKASLVIYAVYGLLASRIGESTVTLIISGMATIAYEHLWRAVLRKSQIRIDKETDYFIEKG